MGSTPKSIKGIKRWHNIRIKNEGFKAFEHALTLIHSINF